MSDPSIAEFYNRVDRIQKARANGLGFEAEGTLGRSFYTRKSRRMRIKIPFLRQIVAIVICSTAMKAVFLYQLGAESYNDRVAKLMAGEGFDRLGGWAMQADPVTVALSNRLGQLLRTLG